MPSQVQLSPCSKLNAIANLSSSLIAAMGAVLDYESVRVKISFAGYVRRTYTRSLLYSCSPLHLQWLSDSSSKAYGKWIKKYGHSEGMHVRTDILDEDGAKLHWIGNENAEKVILYFHGDGFVTPLNKFHLTFMNHLRLELKHDNIDVRIACLEYSLIPFAHFPTQLRQAAQALRHLLALKIPPSNILLAGDSSGGLLLFQLLSHLLHPYPHLEPISIPVLATVDAASRSKFAGILAISPWICPDEDYVDRQFNGNANQGVVDFVPARVVNKWSSLIKATQRSPQSDLSACSSPISPISTSSEKEKKIFKKEKRLSMETTSSLDIDNWQQPYDAPSDWWHDTYKYTSHILITYGAEELMAKDIERFGEDLNAAFRGTKVGARVLSETDGIHCSPLYSSFLYEAEHDHEFMDNISEWVWDQFSKTRRT